MVVITTAAAQSPSFSEAPLFVSGQGGYNTYRIPAIVRGTDGTLLAFCEGRKSSANDAGDIDILQRRSTDDGQSWGPMMLVQEEGGNASIAIGNPAPVVDETTGNIFLFFCRNNDRVFYTSSSDHGVTWSVRMEVTGAVKQPTWGWYATGPGHGIQIKRGAQAGRLIIPCDYRVGVGGEDSGPPGTQVIYSDDHGASWHLGAEAAATPEVYPNENQCVELVAPAAGGGSQLYFNARKLGQAGSAPGMRVDTTSNDGGLTYSRPYASRLDLVCPLFNGGVQGSLQRLRATDAGSTSNRILFSCPNDPAYRVRLSVWSSTNEALSWGAPKVVYEGPSAYSDMAITRSGDVALLYEKGVVSPYETVTFARFNEAWLDTPAIPSPLLAEDPKPAFWNFEEKPAGQLASTSSGAIRDIHPAGYKLNHTAAKGFPYVPGSANYGSGAALAFDGTGGVQLSDAASFNHFDFAATSSFTLEAVFRIPAGSTQTGALVAKDLGGRLPSWWLRVNNGKLQFLVSDYGRQSILNPANLVNDGQWHHVAAIRDAANPASKVLRLYLDGLLIGSMADSSTGTLANSESINIGCFGRDATRNLSGDIDMVRITPAALTAANFLKSYTQFEGNIAVAQASALTDGTGGIDFGKTNVGTVGATKIFTISNPGTADLTGLSVGIDGPDAADFTVSALSKTSIAAGSGTTATFAVTFSPAAGPPSRTAAIHIASNESGTQNTFDIALTGTANNAPADLALSATSLWENVAANTSVGKLSSSDPNPGDTFSYALVNGGGSADNAAFTITGAILKINSTPVLAVKSSYAIRIRIIDSGGLLFEKPFIITITAAGVVFADWAASGGLIGASAAMAATPFNDGVTNLLKYAFNMNAAEPDVRILPAGGTAGLPRTEVDTSGAQTVLRVEFLRRKGSGLVYEAQRATTLADFKPMTGTETVSSIDAYWERVVLEAPFNPQTEPRAFVRVQVSSP
jgi:sialidase-1